MTTIAQLEKEVKKLARRTRALLVTDAPNTDLVGSFQYNDAGDFYYVTLLGESIILSGGGAGPGTGDALTSDPLSQFASTTSAQLAGVISNETGTGSLVFATSPLFVTPRLASTSTIGYVWTATDGSGNGSFQAASGGMTNPLTTTGDIIYSSSGTTPARLGIGATGEFLTVQGGLPVWDSINLVVTAVGTGEPVLFDLGTDILYHRAILGSSLIDVSIVTDDIVITLDSTVSTASNTQTLTNKRITSRYGSTTSSATPTINTDNVDVYELTAQTADITSFTTNLSGTPTIDQTLHIIITGTATRNITWGDSFEASTVALPTATNSTNRLDVFFVWNATTSKWRCGGTW